MRIRISSRKPVKYHIRAERRLEIHDPFTTKSHSYKHTVRTAHYEPNDSDFEQAAKRARNLGIASRNGFGSQEYKVEPVLHVDRLALKIGPISLFRTVDHVPFELYEMQDLSHVEPLPMEQPHEPAFEQAV